MPLIICLLFCVMIKCRNVQFPELVISSILAPPALEVTMSFIANLSVDCQDQVQNFSSKCYRSLRCFSNQATCSVYSVLHRFLRNYPWETSFNNFSVQFGAVLLDLSKAFDYPPHKPIVDKLAAYGISGSA